MAVMHMAVAPLEPLAPTISCVQVSNASLVVHIMHVPGNSSLPPLATQVHITASNDTHDNTFVGALTVTVATNQSVQNHTNQSFSTLVPISSLLPNTTYTIKTRDSSSPNFYSLLGWGVYSESVLCNTTQDSLSIAVSSTLLDKPATAYPLYTPPPSPVPIAATRWQKLYRMTECDPRSEPGV